MKEAPQFLGIILFGGAGLTLLGGVVMAGDAWKDDPFLAILIVAGSILAFCLEALLAASFYTNGRIFSFVTKKLLD